MAAAGTGVAPGGDPVFPQIPVVLPGLLTACNAQSARPMDRVSVGYAYLDRFNVFQTNIGTGLPVGGYIRQPGFNLNIINLGVEKTLLDGRASIYVNAPILEAGNKNVGQQAIDGLGDISFGFKLVLFADCERRNLITGGLTVTVPTAQDVIFPTGFRNANVDSNGVITDINTPTGSVRINPYYYQPWVAAQVSGDRYFVHNYFGVLVPSQSEVATFLNNNFTVGYMVYSGSADGMLRSLAATVDFQALIPVTRRGEPSSSNQPALPPGTPPPAPIFGYSDNFALTPGAQIGLGDAATLNVGVIVPVSGPRAFSTGVAVGFSYNY